MKHLILVRHAKSSWDDNSLDDIERSLNKRGVRDAPIMAKVLKSNFENIDTFLVSPAKRAKMTAKYFHKYYPLAPWKIERSIYEASASELESVIYALDDEVNIAVMFGHNPGFTFLANRYTKKPFDNLPTCGIATIDFKGNKWNEFNPKNAELKNLYFPKTI